MENVGKRSVIKLATTKKEETIWCPNQIITIFFPKKIISNRNEKSQMLMNKIVYLGLSILEISKIPMYEFWYVHVKSKYDEKAKLCYMDTDSLIVSVKTEDIYENIAKNVEKRFDTSDYELERLLPKGRNKKVINCMFLSCHVRVSRNSLLETGARSEV